MAKKKSTSQKKKRTSKADTDAAPSASAASAPASIAPRANFNDLPTELMLHTFEYLQGFDAAKILPTCQEWKQLLDTEEQWQQRTRLEFLLRDDEYSDDNDSDSDNDEMIKKERRADSTYIEEPLPDAFSAKEHYELHFFDSLHRCSTCHRNVIIGFFGEIPHSHWHKRIITCSTCEDSEDSAYFIRESRLQQEYLLTTDEIVALSDSYRLAPFQPFFRRCIDKWMEQTFPGGKSREIERRRLEKELQIKQKMIRSFHNEDSWKNKLRDVLVKRGMPKDLAQYRAANTNLLPSYQNMKGIKSVSDGIMREYRWRTHLSRLTGAGLRTEEDGPRKDRIVHRIVNDLCETHHTYIKHSDLDESKPLPQYMKQNMDLQLMRHNDRRTAKQWLNTVIEDIISREVPDVIDRHTFKLHPLTARVLGQLAYYRNLGEQDRAFESRFKKEAKQVLQECLPRLKRENWFRNEIQQRGYDYSLTCLCEHARRWIDGTQKSAYDALYDQIAALRASTTASSWEPSINKTYQALRFVSSKGEEQVSINLMNRLFEKTAAAAVDDGEDMEDDDDEEESEASASHSFQLPAYWSKQQRESFSSKFAKLIASIDPKMAMEAIQEEVFTGEPLSGNVDEEEWLEETRQRQKDLANEIGSIAGTSINGSSSTTEYTSSTDQESARPACRYNLRSKRLASAQEDDDNEEEEEQEADDEEESTAPAPKRRRLSNKPSSSEDQNEQKQQKQ